MASQRAAIALLTACLAATPLAVGGQETAAGQPIAVRGTVHDLGEAPLAADVTLTHPEAGSLTARTDSRGHWSALLPESGRWEITIRAAGHYPGAGWIAATSAPGGPPIEVRLRSLDEVAPLGWEGSVANLRAIVERANDLLDGGRPAAARAAYETALPHLEAPARAETLRAIARTRFLEGDLEAAVSDLERALAAVPADPATRQLYLALADQRGRRSEADALLAALDRHGVSVLPPSPVAPAPPAVAGPLPPEIASLPVEAAAPGRLGRYRTTFAERAPLSGIEELRLRFAIPETELATDPDGGAVDLAAESFHVFAPEAYRGDQEGWGLLVWLSPTDFGGFVRSEIAAALAAHRLIWVGADGAGNGRARWDRAGLALDAAHHLPRLYDLDSSRVFVAGYSGGGRLACGLALSYPELFSGSVALFGADSFRRLPVPDRPGSFWPPRLPPPPQAILEVARTRPFVLVTGELDFNRAQTQEVHRAMRADGFAHASLLEVPGASHYTPLPADWLDRALTALDRR